MVALPPALLLEILTTDLGLMSPDTTGLTEPIQAVRIRVTSHAATSVHVLVKACEPPFVLRARIEDVCASFPGDVVSVIVREDADSANIECAEPGESSAFAAAAATGTLMRSWGWNESPAIHVEVGERGPTFKVNPVFTASAWIVERMGD